MSTGETMSPPRHAEEVEMLEPEVVRQVRELTALGWGAKRIAAELGVARNTVRRYVRGGVEAEVRYPLHEPVEREAPGRLTFPA